MRKALTILLLVFALALSGGVYAYRDVYSLRDEVMVDETVKAGDVSAAEGLSLTVRTSYSDHLFWDTYYTPGTPEETYSDYRVSVKKDYGDWDYEYDSINLTTDYEMEYFNNFVSGELWAEEHISGLGKAYLELWKETQPGEEREKQIYLKDYMDCYPVGGEINIPGLTLNFYERYKFDEGLYHQESYEHFNEYFRIPVLENEKMYISIRKNESGYISGRGGGSGDGVHYNLYSRCVTFPDAVYFTINNRATDDSLVDTSLIPGGYGIYRLPYYASEGGSEVYLEELCTVKSLDENFDIIYMLTDEAMEKILLIGRIDNALRMLVINAATMETLQDIEIVSTGNTGCWQYFDGGDFLALSIDDNRLGLIERQESGEYLVRFVVEDIADGTYYNRYDVQDMAWNGEKLALSGYKGLDDINERFVADFYYAVYDETGLLCFTDCDSSLCINEDQQWGCVRGNDVNSMTLEWR